MNRKANKTRNANKWHKTRGKKYIASGDKVNEYKAMNKINEC